MGDISKNFSYSEFTQSSIAEENGIKNYIPTADVRNAIFCLVLDILQPLRSSLGASIVINSGYRSKALNKLVGGVESSQHRKGEAADIRSPFFSPVDIARRILTLKLPFDQLIIYPTFVHVSHKRKGPQRGQILYNSRYHGENI